MNPTRTLIQVVLSLLLLVSSVSAREEKPAKFENARVGPYRLKVTYLNAPKGGEALEFTVTADSPDRAPASLSVIAIPGPRLSATPVNAQVRKLENGPWQGSVLLTQQGNWSLTLDADGRFGKATGQASVTAGYLDAPPLALAWLIGLLPILTMVGFVFWRASGKPVSLLSDGARVH
jgi:hypothetical protein